MSFRVVNLSLAADLPHDWVVLSTGGHAKHNFSVAMVISNLFVCAGPLLVAARSLVVVGVAGRRFSLATASDQ